jgi:hypothetical protein
VRVRVTVRLTGAPGANVTPATDPEKICCLAAFIASTAMVRLEPTGACMLTGIIPPLVGFVTGTVVVGGSDISGPSICTWIVVMSDTVCAHAEPALGNQRWMNAISGETVDWLCA